jgi:hypothetical protein
VRRPDTIAQRRPVERGATLPLPPCYSPAPLSWFADEVAAGRQSALLNRTFALTELVEGHHYMEATVATGKVVVLLRED